MAQRKPRLHDRGKQNYQYNQACHGITQGGTAIKRLARYEWLLWSIFALFYYISLACFKYTWLFVSGDSGDWLATAKVWYVPQPFGSPLYISLLHLIGMLPGDLPSHITWLSIIPSSITIGLIYLAAKKLTGKVSLAMVAALICLGASILTTQSIIIEEYALAAMFFTSAILAYIYGKRYTTIILLGLACAVHSVLWPIVGLFYMVHMKEWRFWVKTLPIFFVFGILPYALPFGLMLIDSLPRWIYHGSVISWQGSTSQLGTMSYYDAPKRILQFIGLAFAIFGVALIPASRMLKERKKPMVAWFILTIAFVWWLFLTANDVTIWTFLIYSIPCLSLLAVMGLMKAKFRYEVFAVSFIAIFFICSNTYLLDAKRLNAANPIASDFYHQVWELPDDSYILLPKGGFYMMGAMYAISQGKDAHICFYADGMPDTESPIFMINTIYHDSWSDKYATESYNSAFNKVIGTK